MHEDVVGHRTEKIVSLGVTVAVKTQTTVHKKSRTLTCIKYFIY